MKRKRTKGSKSKQKRKKKVTRGAKKKAATKKRRRKRAVKRKKRTLPAPVESATHDNDDRFTRYNISQFMSG